MTQALLLSTLLLLSAGASPRPNAKGKLQAAQTQFNRGDFEETLQLLDQAKEETSEDGTLSRIHLLRGQAYGALRDLVKAEEALAEALEHDPEATLDANRVDPSLVTMLSGLKSRLRGTLEVTADRPGAKVTYNGKALGTAPLRAQVEIGRSKLEVRTPDGRYGARREVEIRPRRTEKVSVTLSELPPESQGGGSGSPVLFGFGKPLADLRLQLDPFQWTEGMGIEIGGGLQSRYLRTSFHFRVFPAFGMTARGAFSVPVADKVRAYVELELPVIFYGGETPVALGLGGAGGMDYELNKWLSLFAQVGARHFFLSPYASSRLSLQAGVRLEMP